MTSNSSSDNFGLRQMLVVLCVMLIGWIGGKWLLAIEDFTVPYPWQVLQAFVEHRTRLLQATWLSAQAALLGFACSVSIGGMIAIVFSQLRNVRLGCFPFAVILQTVPVVAIAPLIVYWREHGFGSVVIVAFLLSLFPIIANFTAGLTSVPDQSRELFRLLGASRIEEVLKLQIPHAIPDMLTGMRNAAGLSVIGAIIGDLFVGDSSDVVGLGFLIQQSLDRFKPDFGFAGIAMSTVLGIAMFGCVNLLSRDSLMRLWRFFFKRS